MRRRSPGAFPPESVAGLLRCRAEAYSYPTTMCGGDIAAVRHGF